MQSAALAETLDVWIGTGRSSLSRGIYHCQFNTDDGKISEPTLAAPMEGPGFVEKHPKLPVLYAVGGLSNDQVVAAFAIEGSAAKPTLRLMNSVPIGDGGAAHVSLDKTGRTLLTAQYGGGSVAAFAVKEDGSLIKRTALIDHVGGSKAVSGRQDASHAHWTGVSPDNRFAFVPDLGLDQVLIYKLDAASSSIQSHGHGTLPPGSGPRHMKFHPNGRWIYVVNEISLTVTVFDYDADKGTMTAKQTIETVPAADLERERAKSTSEIRVHPNGQFVYAANRGHDTITAFAVDQTTGQLRFVQREPVRGATPRNFNITPEGQWLLAAGQLSHTLAVFSIEPKSGMMTFNQSSVFVPTPICVLFDKR
ncbi:MAG: lactonase family protein [Pirellulaceae bacterium]|nr:lactonase family protein [Pirellulaceae bacterium]